MSRTNFIFSKYRFPRSRVALSDANNCFANLCPAAPPLNISVEEKENLPPGHPPPAPQEDVAATIIRLERALVELEEFLARQRVLESSSDEESDD